MAFWGTEVKPGKPFTLYPGDVDGKLVLTQATLGTGSSSKKSSLQCNVGEKSPIFLCTLLPDKSECCALNLEFEEEDEVEFSVVGPTSIHLSGFIHAYEDEPEGDCCDSDLCGEDIAETESEEDSVYDSEEDDEDDDFIEDDDMSMYPPSCVPNSGVVIEEIEDEKATAENVETKQQKKKNQLADSNNDDKAQKQIVLKGNTGASVLESEDEDGFPVSASHKSEPEAKEGKKKKKKNNAKDDGEGARSGKRKIDAMDHDEDLKGVAAEVVPDENINKKKKKGKAQETSAIEVSKSENDQKLNGDSGATDIVNEDMSKKKNKKKKKAAKTENGDAVVANTEQDGSVEAKEVSATKAKQSKVRTYANGLIIEELEMGKPDGKRASRGSKVSVRYIGKLQKSGKQFDSNIGRAPLKFRLGVGQVIKGWDVGVEGMRVGDKRRLTVPPTMGYGQRGAPPQIPPNAWLVFDVELVGVA